MSPALQDYHNAYIAYWDQLHLIEKQFLEANAAIPSGQFLGDLPKDDPARIRYEKAWNAYCNRQPDSNLKHLAEFVSDEEASYYREKWRDFYYSDKRIIGDPREEVSVSGKYKVVITKHKTKPGCWEYTKARVYRSNAKIAEIRQNYSDMWVEWVEDHPVNHHDYLISCENYQLISCENYQGQTVVDLTTGEKRNYLPDIAKLGGGFCWAKCRTSPDKTMLAVVGCVWAGPDEVKIYDFSHPEECPPFPLLHREPSLDKFKGWNPDNSCEIGTCREVRKSDGVCVHDLLDDAEYEALWLGDDYDPEKVEERWETYRWHRDLIPNRET